MRLALQFDKNDLTPQQIQRFWFSVDIREPDQCWNWKLGVKNGYGTVRFGYKILYSHRVAYILTHGPIDSQLEACHTCNNSLCCNPNHIIPSTHSKNITYWWSNDVKDLTSVNTIIPSENRDKQD